MGYDFHLAAEGPKLIEVNTNAGGAFLNALLARAQRACCVEIEVALGRPKTDDFELAVIRMFQHEWELQKRQGVPRRIAIVDDRPAEQYLYPEFLLAQRFFQKNGIDAVIVDGNRLRYERGQLLAEGQPIDLVYNRLVDFSFGNPEHQDLRAAYLDDAVVVTPNPRVHALYADKRNLTLLSDHSVLRSWGASPQMLADLGGVPHTVLVTSDNAQELWQARKSLFFKPVGRLRKQGGLSRGQSHKGSVGGDHSGRICRPEICRAQRTHGQARRLTGVPKNRREALCLQRPGVAHRGAAISGPDYELPDTGRWVCAGIRNLELWLLSSLSFRPRSMYPRVDCQKWCWTLPKPHQPIAVQQADHHGLQPVRLQQAETRARSSEVRSRREPLVDCRHGWKGHWLPSLLCRAGIVAGPTRGQAPRSCRYRHASAGVRERKAYRHRNTRNLLVLDF